jgi:5-methylthioadenosine/S-adenosylhomocysteine deaminase
MSILIKDVLLQGRVKDIFIEGNMIRSVADDIRESAEHVIDGKNKAVIPSFFNSHTHADMVLFRGFADDMALKDWLETKIWPLESKLGENDVYWGTKLACLEMIKSGTTFFNDMYWHWAGSAKAVQEMGIRAALCAVFIDLFDEKKAREQIRYNLGLFRESNKYSDRVIFTLGPHAVYTVSEDSLLWARDFAEKHHLMIHIHLSETEHEVDECIKRHGKRPVEYLHDLGFLGRNVVAAHAVWVNKKEISILAQDGVSVVHNPTSNMKLAVGNVFPFRDYLKAGVNMILGTDGCGSNNNLDMLEEMKIAALLQKHHLKDPTALPATEVFDMATVNPANAFGLNAGAVKEGSLADLLLVDLRRPELCPNHNLVSNLVYSANGSCVDTTICDGRILMQGRIVPGEGDILDHAEAIGSDFVKR